jgi:DNA-binding LacI/PurR family transcriptional regulator
VPPARHPVTLDVGRKYPALPFVSIDQYFSGRAGAENLNALGYTRIGLVMDGWLDEVLEYRYPPGFLAYHKLQGREPAFLHLKTEFGNAISTLSRDRKVFERWSMKN